MIRAYNRQDLEAELKKSKKAIALFYSSWCPYCVRFVPTFDRKVASLNFESVIHVLLDDFDNPLWDDYDIPAVPTIILFEDCKVRKRLDGKIGLGLSEGQFKNWIDEFKSS